MNNQDLEEIRNTFDYINVENRKDITAFLIKQEPFKDMVIMFNHVKFGDGSGNFYIDYKYSVLRATMAKEEFLPLQSDFEELLTKIIKYVLLWADDNNKLSLIVASKDQ